jgi:hypothetical protein
VSTRKMMRLPLCLALVSPFAGLWPDNAAAQPKLQPAAPKATVQVYRLEVRKPIASLEDPAWESDRRVETGVTIELIVAFKDQMVVNLDPKTTRLSVFSDDKGTDFIKLKPGQALQSLRDNPTFSKDGRFAIKLASAKVPAPGATRILLKGQVGCALGRNLQTGEWNRASKKEGDDYRIGPFSFSIDDKRGSCEFTSDKPNTIKRILFIDKNERELKARLTGQGQSAAYFRFGIVDKDGKIIAEVKTEDNPSFRWSYSFGPEFAKVTVDYYAATETVVVPIDLEIVLGL